MAAGKQIINSRAEVAIQLGVRARWGSCDEKTSNN